MRAGKACREDDLVAVLAIHGCQQGNAIGQLESGFERLGQTLLQVAAYLEAIHYHVDAVLLLLVQLGQFVEFVEAAVDPCANETLGAQLLEERQMFAFALAYHRGQQHALATFGQSQRLVDHLADGLRLQRDVMLRAAWRAGAGIQQAQVVVDLGDGADGRTRIVRGGFLLDGNGWRQPLDGIDIGFFHHRQELPGIGRQRFHIAALAFGVQRIERQRRFARAG